MRQAADILSSAPAMQIRYLEAMQAMAKTAGSKVIFLPGPGQTVQQQMATAERYGEGPSAYGQQVPSAFQPAPANEDLSSGPGGFQNAINSRVIENM